MKNVITAVICLIVASTASASAQASSTPSLHRTNPSAVWRVGLSSGHNGNGVAVSSNHVVTTWELINRCPDCDITVSDDDERHHAATLVAHDELRNLAVLRIADNLGAAVTLWETDTRRGMSVYTYSFGEGWGATRRTGTVRNPSLNVNYTPMHGWGRVSWRVITTTLASPTGSMGSGVFTGSDGRMLGILAGGAADDGSGRIIITAATIRSFLNANGITLAGPSV